MIDCSIETPILSVYSAHSLQVVHSPQAAHETCH